ncbi:hypothetical protein LCGC14_1802720 [marine sediment metagenome]|uniref:Uncharacterized protein n=1 Tax=marine sediment metagenome TaxID=412755 RepID=A0A0F9J3S6_9ZZZZ
MADEQEQEPTLDDLDAELLNITSEQWETAGLTQAGKVGFKIISSKLAAAKDKNGVYPRAELEVIINARPNREVTGKGERHWENLRLDGSFLRTFKNLAVSAGIKIQPGSKLALKEVVSALAGRAAFGTIVHRDWIGRGGEKNTSANFGNRFGKSFKELS